MYGASKKIYMTTLSFPVSLTHDHTADHAAQVARSSNGTMVINHNRIGYQSDCPSPGYSGSYATR